MGNVRAVRYLYAELNSQVSVGIVLQLHILEQYTPPLPKATSPMAHTGNSRSSAQGVRALPEEAARYELILLPARDWAMQLHQARCQTRRRPLRKLPYMKYTTMLHMISLQARTQTLQRC